MCGFIQRIGAERQPLPAPLTTLCPIPRVGLDEIDDVAYACIPKAIRGETIRNFLAQISALAVEGGHGGAARRLLAREVALARANLRVRESVANLEIQKLGTHRFDPDTFEMLEKAVMNAHRRLMISFDHLGRLDAAQAPRIRINANQAQLNFEATP
jgi:hypothetical protein